MPLVVGGGDADGALRVGNGWMLGEMMVLPHATIISYQYTIIAQVSRDLVHTFLAAVQLALHLPRGNINS